MANLTRGIPLSKISPKFLHSNATSHTGPFSAIAELIDNAYDPDVSASELHIDKCVIHGKPCLVFQDDGAGMDFDRLLKMLSFGYCDKTAFEDNAQHLPIGHYGNGFKSGSMRLGKDALVFTVCKRSASVGFLSQTYLEAIGADCVFVPMIEYRLPHLERIKSQESRNNLEAIMTHSPFRTEQDLKAELQTLYNKHTDDSTTTTRTGTKIVIYSLRRHKDRKLELDFESDSTDIRNPEAHEVDLTSVYHRTSQVDNSEYMRSLRVYCSILFLRPRMKIHIRGVKVKTQIISKSLSNTEIDVYKPTWLNKPLRITFGFSTKTPIKDDYGVMFYNRNRLIKAYEKLGYQKQPNDLGIGVVGVVQVDFLKPIHNKQDFEKDEKYKDFKKMKNTRLFEKDEKHNAIMSSIGGKLNDYWNEKKNGQTSSSHSAPRQLPDWLWVQCEQCLKWRRLPDSERATDLPEQWLCYMNPDPTHNRCEIAEEPEDEDEAVQRPTYAKTFKKKLEEKKRRKQADIEAKEKELKAREAALLEAQRQKEMNEVSSSQQSQRDIASLQRALLEARKREEDQKRLIVKIQNQKKEVSNQQNSLLEAAQNLKTAQTATSELLEVASAMTEDSPVSSTSKPSDRKRRSSEADGGGRKKVMNITTDQGDTVTIERANSDNDDEAGAAPSPEAVDPSIPATPAPPAPPPSTTRKVAKQRTSTPRSSGRSRRSASTPNTAKVSVIDLTMDEDDMNDSSSSTADQLAASSSLKCANTTEVSTTSTAITTKETEAVDIKPDINQLNQDLQSQKQPVENGVGHTESTPSADPKMKVKDEDEGQLVLLQQKYRLLTRRFNSLQSNVHKLLSFIVPDVDLGPEEDIEHIVTEMIRVNCNQTEHPS